MNTIGPKNIGNGLLPIEPARERPALVTEKLPPPDDRIETAKPELPRTSEVKANATFSFGKDRSIGATTQTGSFHQVRLQNWSSEKKTSEIDATVGGVLSDSAPAGDTASLQDTFARWRALPGNSRLTFNDARRKFLGHALTRHTGKSDSEILTRMREDGLLANGAFPDAATAEAAVAKAIDFNRKKITAWLEGPTWAGDRFTISGFDTGGIIGRGANRGVPQVHDERVVRCTLEKLDYETYVVVTAFPVG